MSVNITLKKNYKIYVHNYFIRIVIRSRGHSPTANKQHVHYELWPDSQGDIKVSHTTSMKPEQRYLKNNQKVSSNV